MIYDLAGHLGAAPSRLSFGGSVARLVRGLWKNRQSKIINRKWNGAVAGNRIGRASWQEAILLLNHNREIKRAGSVIALPARAISLKNKHLLVIYSIPT